MERMRFIVTVGVLVLATSTPAAAQQKEPKGRVTMGYPPVVGILWHESDRVAVRPNRLQGLQLPIFVY